MKFMKLKLISLFVIAVFGNANAIAQIYPPDAIVEGKTIAEWAGQNATNWEYWLLDQGITEFETRSVHPNDLAAFNNDGPVFFTAGYFGPYPDEPIIDELLVPPGRPIVQRLFDISGDLAPQDVDASGVPVWVSGEPSAAIEAPDAVATLAAMNGIVDSADIYMEFDGVVYTPEQIDAFSVEYQTTITVGNNPFGVVPGEYPAAGAGRWLILEPFEPGETHTLRTGGLNDDGSVFPDITINFTAVPEPSSFRLLAIAGIVFTLTRRKPLRTS